MKRLNPALVTKVRSALSGSRLAKFDASIAILNESLLLGGWTPRGSVKAKSGFYQGLVPHLNFNKDYSQQGAKGKAQDLAWGLAHTLNFGGGVNGKVDASIVQIVRNGSRDRHGELAKIKPSDDVILAWVELCAEKNEAFELLTRARPLPTITRIGLSPKVTKTLIEMNLDIELSSIRMAQIVTKYRLSLDDSGKPILDKKGKQILVPYQIVVWSKGIVHGASRFAIGGCCEACGKPIPSRMFVPIEALDKASGKLVSMWLGCDCAKNIFGVKDIGVRK